MPKYRESLLKADIIGDIDYTFIFKDSFKMIIP